MAGFNEAGTDGPVGAGATAIRRVIRRALVAGASGGIGGGLLTALLAREGIEQVYALQRSGRPSTSGERPEPLSTDAGALVWLDADLEDEASLMLAARRVDDDGGGLDLVVIATGLLHAPGIKPERRVEDLDPGILARALAVNAIGPLLLARHLLPLMRTGDNHGNPLLLALSARVGSLGDNRLGGWYAYRMGKAALNQGFRTLAAETRRRWPGVVISLYHPGTVVTRLSAPFSGGGQGPGHERFTPAEAAWHCLRVVDGLGPAEHGGFFAWDGQAIPW